MINTIEHRITILIIVARIGMTLNTPEMFGSISGDEFYIRQEQTQVVPMICPLLKRSNRSLSHLSDGKTAIKSTIITS